RLGGGLLCDAWMRGGGERWMQRRCAGHGGGERLVARTARKAATSAATRAAARPNTVLRRGGRGQSGSRNGGTMVGERPGSRSELLSKVGLGAPRRSGECARA